jgi:hypothetical protein
VKLKNDVILLGSSRSLRAALKLGDTSTLSTTQVGLRARAQIRTRARATQQQQPNIHTQVSVTTGIALFRPAFSTTVLMTFPSTHIHSGAATVDGTTDNES